MPQTRTSGLTYNDLVELFPGEDAERRELVDGRLLVTPSPLPSHQWVALLFAQVFMDWALDHDAIVMVAPMDLEFGPGNVRQPDLFAYRPGRRPPLDERPIRFIPDLVLEISSPSTRHHDLGDRLRTYERFSVPEYWFVDLEASQVAVHRLRSDRYGEPRRVRRSETLTSTALPGLVVSLGAVFDHLHQRGQR